jgi:hypothetical protein
MVVKDHKKSASLWLFEDRLVGRGKSGIVKMKLGSRLMSFLVRTGRLNHVLVEK